MAFAIHPFLSTYPGASFFPNGNLNGPHLGLSSGGHSLGYWGHVPMEFPSGYPFAPPGAPGAWGEVPAMVAMREGRGNGYFGGVGGERFNYGWPKYGPVSLLPALLEEPEHARERCCQVLTLLVDAAQT